MLVAIAFLGGAFSLFSPCILPLLPLVFLDARQPRHERVLVFTGLALAFAALGTAAVLGVRGIAAAGTYGRWLALILYASLALSLISARVSGFLARPFSRVGGTLDLRAARFPARLRALGSGVALGFLWSPCAGPILGLVLVGSIPNRTAPFTFTLLAAFAAGASSALAVLLLAGRSVRRALGARLGAEAPLRRAAGVVALAVVALMVSGLDRRLLAGVRPVAVDGAESRLIERWSGTSASRDALGEPLSAASNAPAGPLPAVLESVAVVLPDEGSMPEFPSGREWINSAPLTAAALRGKVVLVNFWTFDCINCLRALPYVKALHARYKDQGLVVIGVHTPELARERVPANVRKAVTRLGISHPVVIDGDYAIWQAWRNQYWPAVYLVDATGRVRFHHFGEGQYEEQEVAVRALLAEAKARGPGT
jgi:cytochrome c biogenesis protein CcdA/thiol-disulfide isomerase/thioredoxin